MTASTCELEQSQPLVGPSRSLTILPLQVHLLGLLSCMWGPTSSVDFISFHYHSGFEIYFIVQIGISFLFLPEKQFCSVDVPVYPLADGAVSCLTR